MQPGLQEYFSRSVSMQPDAVAIEVDGLSYTYRQLNDTVSALSATIEAAGFKNKAILVVNNQDYFSYAALLAIHFSGNVFVPVHESWPEERIKEITGIVKPVAVAADTNNSKASYIKDLQRFLFTLSPGTVSHPVKEPAYMAPGYPGIAYVLFTSGSTGIPKGVPVKRESLDAFLTYYKTFNFSPADRFLQVYDITFDVAWFSFFVPLTFGACCCILNRQENLPKNLSVLSDLVKRRITVVSMVPTIINFAKKYLRNEKIKELRYSFFSGDVLYHSDAVTWQAFAPGSQIHNYYGLTETTIVCTGYVWTEQQGAVEAYNDRVPIGKPFPGTQYLVVTEENDAVAHGERGELAFAGVQIIDAYLGNICAEKFFKTNTGVTYYKTGDLVSVNTNGNIIFHGRTDQQIKVNGYRIEPGEIEAAIKKLTLKDNVVVKMKNHLGGEYITAFIEGEKLDTEGLKKSLTLHIPSYMLPSEYVFVATLPLNQNGKIDTLYLKTLAANENE